MEEPAYIRRIAALSSPSLLDPRSAPTFAPLWVLRSPAVFIPTSGGCRGLGLFRTGGGMRYLLCRGLIGGDVTRGGCVRGICQLWMEGGFKCL